MYVTPGHSLSKSLTELLDVTASLMPVSACESLAILDTTHCYFIDAEVEGQETKHLHRALILQQNQELRGSWLWQQHQAPFSS